MSYVNASLVKTSSISYKTNRFLVFMIKGKLVGNSDSLIVSGELSIALVIVKVRKKHLL